MGVRCVTLLSLPQETPRKNEVLGTAWKLQFFQPKAAALFLEEVVVFALQAVFFFPGSGQVIKESQMHFSYRLVPAPVKSWQREKEMLGTMTHLFLRQILRAGLLICQEMAKYHYIQDQTVSSSPYIASRTVSNTHTHTHTHTSLSHVRLFAAPWIVAHQAPRSMGFSRHEYWSGLPFPSPGDLPDPGIEPRSPAL